MPIMEGIETAGKSYGDIARISGADPQLEKNIAATVKGGLMGSLMAKGGIETYSKLNELKRKNKQLETPAEIPPTNAPDIKKTLLASAVKNVENKLNLIKQKEQELTGFENLSPDLQKEQEFLYQQRLKLEADLEHLNSIMGVTKEKPSFTNREDIINAISDTEKQIQALKKKSQTTQLTENEINLYDNLQLKLNNHKKELGSIIEQEKTKPKFDDSIKETPPVEVALVKISQVGKDKKKALKYKEKAIEKLSTLVEEQNINNIPGKDYNALRRSLEEEIKAYDEIIAGREPNLDWFNDKENKPLEPTARPLEGVKTTEPILTPELTTLRPLEKAVDTNKPEPFKH
jgi:vacuolar-type H+-ATPase subunit I/STV1